VPRRPSWRPPAPDAPQFVALLLLAPVLLVAAVVAGNRLLGRAHPPSRERT
jgi:hypothetical protein